LDSSDMPFHQLSKRMRHRSCLQSENSLQIGWIHELPLGPGTPDFVELYSEGSVSNFDLGNILNGNGRAGFRSTDSPDEVILERMAAVAARTLSPDRANVFRERGFYLDIRTLPPGTVAQNGNIRYITTTSYEPGGLQEYEATCLQQDNTAIVDGAGVPVNCPAYQFERLSKDAFIAGSIDANWRLTTQRYFTGSLLDVDGAPPGTGFDYVNEVVKGIAAGVPDVALLRQGNTAYRWPGTSIQLDPASETVVALTGFATNGYLQTPLAAIAGLTAENIIVMLTNGLVTNTAPV